MPQEWYSKSARAVSKARYWLFILAWILFFAYFIFFHNAYETGSAYDTGAVLAPAQQLIAYAPSPVPGVRSGAA